MTVDLKCKFSTTTSKNKMKTNNWKKSSNNYETLFKF